MQIANESVKQIVGIPKMTHSRRVVALHNNIVGILLRYNAYHVNIYKIEIRRESGLIPRKTYGDSQQRVKQKGGLEIGDSPSPLLVTFA